MACGHARREPEMRTPPGTWRASTLVRALGLAYPWPAHCLAPRALGQGSPRPALETPVSLRGSFSGFDSPLYRVVEYIPSLPLPCGDSLQLSRQSGPSCVTRGGAPLQSKTVCFFLFFELTPQSWTHALGRRGAQTPHQKTQVRLCPWRAVTLCDPP